MRELMWLLLTNTAIAALLSLVALLVMQCRRPALAHVIWLLVIVKLITPPVWRVALPVSNQPPPTAVATVVVNPTPVVISSIVETPIQSIVPVIPAPMPVGKSPLVIPWEQILLGVWIGGAMAYLAVAWARFRSFRRLIVQAEHDDALLDEVKSLAGKMAIRPPRMIVTSAAVSPMVLILNRAATLLLPMPLLRTLDSQQRRAVIVHELAHLRRGDHLVRLFEMFATALLWWHPLLWLARWGLRDAEEQCCDAWVVSILPDERRRFADALVDSMEFISRCPVPAAASGLGHVRSLKRRLAMIVNRTPPKSLSAAGWIVAAMLLVAVMLTPVRGDEPASAPATKNALVDDNTRRIITALLDAAQDSDQQVQAESQHAILQFRGEAVPVLIEALENPRTARIAAGLLGGLGVDAVDPLLQSLQSPKVEIRHSALKTLSSIFVRQSGINLPGTGGLFQERPEMGMEGQAMMPGGEWYGGMGGMAAPGAQAPETIDLAKRLFPPVAKATEDADLNVRRAAIALLSSVAQMKPSNYSSQPFVARLGDEDAGVRLTAAQALSMVRPADADVVKALAGLINDRNDDVQMAALMALAAIGPEAKGATDAVLAALKSANPQLRMMAARALGAMQAKPGPAEGGVPMGEVPGAEGGPSGVYAPPQRHPGGVIPPGQPAQPNF